MENIPKAGSGKELKRFEGMILTQIEQCEIEINRLESLITEHNKLIGTLSSLPNTLTRPVRVPLGRKAFFQGRLAHTNEIMVLLGDNWFTDRTAPQAADIARRRSEKISESLRKWCDEKRDLISRVEAVRELMEGDTKEIHEDYTESDEKAFWDKRREVSARRKNKQKSEGIGDAEKKRLEELEVMEMENKELEVGLGNKLEDKRHGAIENVTEAFQDIVFNKGKKQVHWETPSETEEVGETTDVLEPVVVDDVLTITFRHGPTRTEAKPIAIVNETHSKPVYSSPGDIKFIPPAKGILKVKTTSAKNEEVILKAGKSNGKETQGDCVQPAFSGIVKQRTDPMATMDVELSGDVRATNPDKPVSRFKMLRQSANK